MQTIETLKRFVIKEMAAGHGLKSLDENQSLLETGILDSLGILKLVASIEAQFLLKIEGEELIPENFETLSNISRVISNKKSST